AARLALPEASDLRRGSSWIGQSPLIDREVALVDVARIGVSFDAVGIGKATLPLARKCPFTVVAQALASGTTELLRVGPALHHERALTLLVGVLEVIDAEVFLQGRLLALAAWRKLRAALCTVLAGNPAKAFLIDLGTIAAIHLDHVSQAWPRRSRV